MVSGLLRFKSFICETIDMNDSKNKKKKVEKRELMS